MRTLAIGLFAVVSAPVLAAAASVAVSAFPLWKAEMSCFVSVLASACLSP